MSAGRQKYLWGIHEESMPPRDTVDRRVGHAEDVADVVQFLANDAAASSLPTCKSRARRAITRVSGRGCCRCRSAWGSARESSWGSA
jgi:NAD(P)-dependent dehydrogenase (short-subunit alcohol dehydrogenase family)